MGPDYVAPRRHPHRPRCYAGSVDYVADHPVAVQWSQFDDLGVDQAGARIAARQRRCAHRGLGKVDEGVRGLERPLDLAPHVTAGVEGTRTKQPAGSQGRGDRQLLGRLRCGLGTGPVRSRAPQCRGRACGPAAAQRNDLQAMRVTVAAEVARNLLELRGTAEALDVARRILVSLGETQRLTESRFDLGAGSQLEAQSSLAA